MGIAETKTTQKLKDNKMMSGWRLFRHQVGTFYQGKVNQGILKNGRRVMVIQNFTTIKMGVKGESDEFGFIPLKITDKMIGSTIAQFAVVEVKTKKYKTVTTEQMRFLKAIRKSGGRAFICRESDCVDGFELEELK